MPRVKVSVVVPVYNTGKYVDECAPSLLGQSLPADEYEVIYVDDGSTDDTLSRLEKIAAGHPNVQVHTQPNSGWPGAPRNLGMRHAKGEYIQFVDHDDTLGPEALERLYDHAKRNDADVVLGKMSSTMVRPRRLFRHTVDTCTIENDELTQSMSPHKMFRRAFVEEHGLQFPEGPWILEDLAFVSAAYLKAERISILADYPVYYWMKRDDGGNNTQHRFNPKHGFWSNTRAVVRQFKDATPASDDIDALLQNASSTASTTWRFSPAPASRRSSARTRPSSARASRRRGKWPWRSSRLPYGMACRPSPACAPPSWKPATSTAR